MIFTFGHSTLSQEDFITATKDHVETIIDIRSHPTSRWEQFRKEQMGGWLPESGIKYEWWPSLGGWDSRHLHLQNDFIVKGVDIVPYAMGKFPKQRIGKNFPDSDQLNLPDVKPSWTNVGLYDFQYFLSLPEAMEGIHQLVQRGERENVAIICCEAQWWRCHRSMVSDALASKKVESCHLMPQYRQKNLVKYVVGSKKIPHSSVIGNRLERYEREVTDVWSKHLI